MNAWSHSTVRRGLFWGTSLCTQALSKLFVFQSFPNLPFTHSRLTRIQAAGFRFPLVLTSAITSSAVATIRQPTPLVPAN